MTVVIESVTLEDFKSYADRTTIELGDGVTAIVGENGSGKSTVQEAIGFALFDTHPFDNQDRLVRDGESSGHVEVTFRVVETGEVYTVRRWAGRYKFDVLNANGDALGLDTGSAIKEWVAEKLGVDDADDLSEVWERSVGVPQTSFLADFTQSEKERVDTFDPLFDIERYREAYKSLSGLESQFDEEITAKNEEVSELRGELNNLPDVESEVEELEAKLREHEAEIATIEHRVTVLQAEHTALGEVEAELDEKRGELESLENTKIPTAEEQLEQAEEALAEAEAAVETLSDVEDEYEAHREAESERERLEEEIAERDELVDERDETEGKIDRKQAKAEQKEEAVETAEQAKERLEELEPDVEEYRELETEVEELEEAEERIAEIDSEISEHEAEISDLEGEIEELEDQIGAAEARRDEAEKLETLRDERHELSVERESLEKEVEELEAQNEELREIDVDEASDVPCPTCDRPITAEHRDSVIEENTERIKEIESSELQRIDSRLNKLADEIDDAKAASDAVSEITTHESEIDALREKIGGLESTIEELRSEQSELESRTEDLPEKQRRLEALNGVETEYTTAKTRYEDNKSAEAELESLRERIGELEVEVAELNEEIASYGDLDSELEAVKETLAETKEGYKTYIAHEEEAGKRDKREEAVEEAESELADLRSEAERVREAISELESEFDEERFEALDGDIGAFEAERNRLEGKRETVEGNLNDAQSELDDLHEKQSEKEALEAEITELERDKRFAGWSRNTLQQGAADLRELITTEIGHRANEVFQQLRGNPTETLMWDKTYNLRVRVKGQDKPFDSLSGGEKMAAALAVRLAILERLASVGMAFLDEPTANLDTEKKQNLVNQLESLEGLGQLTVVSHDRTFEAMTERAIVLEKDETDEVTRVVSQ